VIEILEGLLEGPVTLEDLKHRPGRRRTLRVRGPNGTAIVKLYSSNRAPVVAARIAALGAGPPEPQVPVVLRTEPRLGMVVLSEVPGRPLRHAMLEEDVEACSRAGAVLAAWHGFWRTDAPRVLAPHTLARELEILRDRSKAASAAIASAVRSELASVAGEWLCTTVVHRDLYEEQVLVGDRVGLIDLDDSALGPPELDLGNLLAHLELLELRSGRDLGAAVEALLRGYGWQSLDSPLLDRCRRLSLLRLACIHGTPELLGRARADAAATRETARGVRP
jgi:aminoglycoside phosphotransferase (APT) family kinase protein